MNSATISWRRIFKQNIRIALTILLVFLLFIPQLVLASFLDFDGQSDPDNRKFFYHPDILGSTDLITNESGGIVEETTYEPYGEVIEGGNDRFLYTRKELDKQSGLYYFGARYYNPSIPLFIHPDDTITGVFNPQDLNRYAYVRNNPYKYIDPDGETPWDIIDIGFIAYGAYQFARDPSWSTAGNLGLDVGFAVLPIVPNVKRIKEAAKAMDKAGNIARGGEKVSDVGKGVDKAGDLKSIEDSRSLPDFYGTSNKEIVPSRTPAGREITPHAAERMANPPRGRDVMTPSEVDEVIRQATTRNVDPVRRTTTHFAPALSGKPKVVTSNTHGGRVVTTIKKIVSGSAATGRSRSRRSRR